MNAVRKTYTKKIEQINKKYDVELRLVFAEGFDDVFTVLSPVDTGSKILAPSTAGHDTQMIAAEAWAQGYVAGRESAFEQCTSQGLLDY